MVVGHREQHDDQDHVDGTEDQARPRHAAPPGALTGPVQADGPEDDRERAEDDLGDEDPDDSADQSGDCEPVGSPGRGDVVPGRTVSKSGVTLASCSPSTRRAGMWLNLLAPGTRRLAGRGYISH